MKASAILLFTLLFLSNSIFSQNTFVLSGKIVDQKTSKRLPYAHLGIPRLGIGTTTSDQGFFEFKIPYDKKEEELVVSFIGYATYRKKVKDLSNPVTIQLRPVATDLLQIEVLDQTAVESIIREAVKNIPKNYPTHPHTNLAFYRESRTGKDSQYLYLAEGVLKVYKKSYKSAKEGQVSLVEGRKINLKNPLDTILQGGLSSGHMAAHRFDFVYNREDFLQEKYFPAYKYWIESMTSYNESPVYVIGFDKDTEVNKTQGTPKSKHKARMKGRLYIDKNSYAIIKGEFEITPEGLKKHNDYPLYVGDWNGNSFVVNYQKLGDKWYFNDAFRKGHYSSGGVYMNEVKITEIKPEKSEPLPYLDRLKKGQRFTRMTGNYDADFWKNYNTTPLNSALATSMEELRNAKKAQEALDPAYLAELQRQRDSIELVNQELAAAQERIDIEGLDLSEMELPAWQKKVIERKIKQSQKPRKRKRYKRFAAAFGLGTHLIATESQQLGITILTGDQPGATILSLSDELKARNFEVIGKIDLDIFYRKNLFVRLGSAFDFWNSRYKERSIGFGAQANLSRQRPFFIRAVAEYGNLKYYRSLGIADNDFGKFKIDGKTFKADDIKLAYGSKTHNLKLSAEMAIELNPSQEFYLRGSYYLPFARRQDVFLQERQEVFRKKEVVHVGDPQVAVTRNDVPFEGSIMPKETISLTVGWRFK